MVIIREPAITKVSPIFFFENFIIVNAYLGSSLGVSRLLGGNALCIYGAPSGLTNVPFSPPNLSINKPDCNVTTPWIVLFPISSWNPLSGG
jgi:hypothetical protein